jgi:hypothetical protein
METEERNSGGDRFHPAVYSVTTKVTAIACVLLTAISALIFWNGSTRCSPETSWTSWAFAAFWTLVVVHQAFTWRRFARKVFARIAQGQRTYIPTTTTPNWYSQPAQFNAYCVTKINFDHVFAAVGTCSILFVALPLIFIAIGCQK